MVLWRLTLLVGKKKGVVAAVLWRPLWPDRRSSSSVCNTVATLLDIALVASVAVVTHHDIVDM